LLAKGLRRVFFMKKKKEEEEEEEEEEEVLGEPKRDSWLWCT
jgi:hypothetical protein